MAEILDLDALVPEPAQVRFNGELYPVTPPSVESVIEIIRLGDRLKSAAPDKVEKETQSAFARMRELIEKCVPGLKGEISLEQMVGLSQFILKRGIPDLPQLEKQGITPKSAKKKAS